ncbi:hypothetical protein ABZW18_33495 [Streptomyces sp. NPDC004647]|uniref:hypothetical protein n=1 Tax=Streptomyces sp. NPDC004647 TaxID=3154671 RepID=UPI0033BE971A
MPTPAAPSGSRHSTTAPGNCSSARLLAEHQDAVERSRGAKARATAAGQSLPDDLTALAPEELARLCPARHGAYGRICARTADHTPDLHLGWAPDGAWIAWLTARSVTRQVGAAEAVRRSSELVSAHRDEFGDLELVRVGV